MNYFVIAQSAISTLLAALVVWGVKKVISALHGVGDRIDKLYGATQTTMRTTLVHNFEKYLTRGWITPEEKASWCDMYEKYEGLGANGYIRSYRAKLDVLKEIPTETISPRVMEGVENG